MPDLADIRAAVSDLLTAIDAANLEAIVRAAMVDEQLVRDEDRAVALLQQLRAWSEV